MITRTERVVEILCDAPACKSSTGLVNQNASSLDKLIRKAATDGWGVHMDTKGVKHLCPKCVPTVAGCHPLMNHLKGGPHGHGLGLNLGRGSEDVTGVTQGLFVSAAKLHQVKSTATPPAVQPGDVVALNSDGTVRPVGSADPALVPADPMLAAAAKARRKDILNGTPGLSELPEDKRQELAAKLDRGKSVFTLTLNLDEQEG